MNKKIRLKLIAGIVILLIGIFTIVSYSLKREEYSIPSFAIFRWYREVDGVKEYLVFNKNNTIEYYDENNNNLLEESCQTYEYNKYVNEIDVKCKYTTLNYKIVKYKDSVLDIKFNTGDVREFKLEEIEEIDE